MTLLTNIDAKILKIFDTMKKYCLDLTVVSVEPLSEKHVLLRLTHDAPLPEMQPGQFVEVRVDHSPTTFLRRPISIHFVDRARNELWLLVAAIVDLKVRYAPDSFSVAFLAVAVFDIVFYGVPVSSALIGMLFPGLAFFLACAFKPDLIGGADIKMLITLGACLGTLQTTSLYLMSCIVLCTLYVPLWLKGKLEKNEKPIFIPAIFGFYVAYMLVQYEPQYLQLFDI